MVAAGHIEIFEYPAAPDSPLPGWDGWATALQPEGGVTKAGETHPATPGGVENPERAEFEERLAVETRRAFEAGRERGRQEGCRTEREAQTAAEAAREERRAEHAAELIRSFVQERDRYLREVEREVVKLSLAVAARILRRESQMDPLLLTGAVRVALGQLAATTEVRLRVPPDELDLWIEAIGLLPNLALKPIVTAGEGMRLGDCRIETGMGSVDLGIRAQLSEIERGFFDRAGGSRAESGAGQEESAIPDREASR